MRALAGLAGLERGSIHFGGTDVTAHALAQRRAAGLRIIPFDRNSEGLSLTSALWENWSARRLLLAAPSPIAPSRFQKACGASLKEWDVRFADTASPPGRCRRQRPESDLAREIDADASLVIAAQPTRGLDIGATAFVWRGLRASRDRAAACS